MLVGVGYFSFFALTQDDVKGIVKNTLADKENGFGGLNVTIDDDAMAHLANVANGDARTALNAVELAVLTTAPDSGGVIRIDLETAEQSIQRGAVRCDDEEYYNMLSAFCKSLRGSDADAALFWFARMIYAGVRSAADRAAHSRSCQRRRWAG